jgi:hypothetical protein
MSEVTKPLRRAIPRDAPDWWLIPALCYERILVPGLKQETKSKSVKHASHHRSLHVSSNRGFSGRSAVEHES